MLAIANLQHSLFWALLIAWVLSVVLHEFAHGLVAYWGGDYTIRERGGLTLNPLQYVDPVFSIILPIVFLLMGGLALPGGSTYVRRDLLRSRAWDSAVSLAGPAMNFILFLLCALPLHPKIGWLDPTTGAEHNGAQLILAATAILQITAVVFNLIPIPPLDGFQAISPWLSPDLRQKVMTPPVSTFLLIAFFVVMMRLPLLERILVDVAFPLLHALGFSRAGALFFLEAFQKVIWG